MPTRAATLTLARTPERPPRPLAQLPPSDRPDAALTVLDVTKYFGTTSGGIRTYLLEKARYVASRPDLRSVLVVPGREDAIRLGHGARTYHLRGPAIPAYPPYRFLLATRSLRRIVEHERPDLIEVGSPFLVPWLTQFANRRLQAPLVWYYHSHLPRLAIPDPSRAGRGRRALATGLGRYVRLLGSRFPVVLCASTAMAEALRDLGVPRVVRVPLGVDLDHFHPWRRAVREETRRRVGLPSGPLVVFAGRFAAEKRLDVVLDAWPEVMRTSGFRLALIGDGPQAAALRAHRAAPLVTWLPWEPDRHRLADILASADLYLAPGPAETFGLTIIEAMATGVPVLAVNAGAAPEWVEAAGAGGCYADGSPDDLVQAADALATADLTDLGRKSRAYVEREHGWETVLARLFRVYRDVVADRSAS